MTLYEIVIDDSFTNMLHKTKGIVLRTVKYGETSVIVTIFTALFGVQSYLANGVRTASKKSGSSKAALFQPATILDLVVYHSDLKNLQRLKEFKWEYLYQHIFSDVRKNAVALFMIELLGKCLKQPEAHGDLFHFAEDALHHLDEANEVITANMPLFFAVHLAVFFGFRVSNNLQHSPLHYLDLQEGKFTDARPSHAYYLAGHEAAVVSILLKTLQPAELEQLALNQETRRRIMDALEMYYALHVPDFGTMRTLPVLREIIS